MITPNQFKNGIFIKIDDEIYVMISFQHIKPGKGGAFIRTKLKSIRLGTVIQRTFREIDTVEEVFLEQKKLQYLYRSGDTFYFMDEEDYEQIAIPKKQLEDHIPYLKENEKVCANFHKGDIVAIALPIFVNLKVLHTEPGIRGDTAKGGSKSAKLETGYSVQVPLFINTGDTVKIDTRTGEYVGRA